MSRHPDLTPPEEAATDELLGDEVQREPSLRTKVAKGVAGAFAYQVFSACVSLASLIFVARLVTPAEFGAFIYINLVLQWLSGLAVVTVARHALYRGDDTEPPWNLYFFLLVIGESILFLLCNVVAAVFWFIPPYQAYAPLLHLASTGYVIEAFAEMDRVMALKRLEFGRLQVLTGCAEVLRVVVVILFALAGLGLYGLLFGNAVLISLPFVFHLLRVRRWRPSPSRWREYSRAELMTPVRFALNFSAANGGNVARQFAESMLIPLAFSTADVGYLSRALGLYSQTAGRILQGVNEPAGAVLPSLKSNPERLHRGALAYLKVMGGLLFAAVALLAAVGPTISAVLYGPRWKEVDPYILPAALQAASYFFSTVCAAILLTTDRQRSHIILLGAMAVGSVPGLVALGMRTTPGPYLWTQGISFLVVAGLGLILCRPVIGLRRPVAQLIPAAFAAAAAYGAAFLTDQTLQQNSKWLRLPLDVLAFGVVHLAVMRFGFPRWLSDSLGLVPMGNVLRRWLKLTPPNGY